MGGIGCEQVNASISNTSESSETTQKEFTAAGIERVIPLRFMHLRHSWDTTVPITNAEQSVDRLNRVYKAAGIQFRIHSYDSAVTPILSGANTNNPNLYPWSSVWSEFNNFFPVSSLSYPSNTERTIETWLGYILNDFRDTSVMHFWVQYNNQKNYAGQPKDHPGIMFSWAWLGPHTGMAHEVGHHMGLQHLDALHLSFNPQTSTSENMAEFWDLVFCPGTSSSNPHQYFSSRTQAFSASCAAGLKSIDRGGETTGGWANCTATCNNFTTCDIAESLGSAYHETGVTSTDARLSRGLTNVPTTPAPPPYGVNVMTYLGCGGDAPNHITSSQIAALRRHLRYQVSTQHPVWPNRPGHLVLEGQHLNRQLAYKVDFDGDGKRDLALYWPPVDSSSTGQWKVYLSSTTTPFSTTSGQFFSANFGQLGDLPLLGDFNNDGRTDIAVYRASGSGATSSASWIWCPTTSSGLPTGCSGSNSAAFGERREIPLPGHDLNGDGVMDLLVLRPADNTWRWVYGPAFTGTPITRSPVTFPVNLQPLPGLYDDDNKTDLVLYDRTNATFHLTTSSSSWNTTLVRSFSTPYTTFTTGTAEQRANSIPIWGTFSLRSLSGGGYGHRMGLALWEPEQGKWGSMWNPVSSSTMVECVVGIPGDVPLGLIGTNFNQSSGTNYSSMSVFRPGGGATNATLLMKASNGSDCSGSALTLSSSLGFVTERKPFFPVADMLGDGKPEILQVDPEGGTIKYWNSSTSYLTGTTLPVGDAYALVL